MLNIALSVARLTWVLYLAWPLAVLAANNDAGSGWSNPMDGVFIEHAPLANATTGVMRAVRLPKESKKVSTTAATVCKTPKFDLTVANWRLKGVHVAQKFLGEYRQQRLCCSRSHWVSGSALPRETGVSLLHGSEPRLHG